VGMRLVLDPNEEKYVNTIEEKIQITQKKLNWTSDLLERMKKVNQYLTLSEDKPLYDLGLTSYEICHLKTPRFDGGIGYPQDLVHAYAAQVQCLGAYVKHLRGKISDVDGSLLDVDTCMDETI